MGHGVPAVPGDPSAGVDAPAGVAAQRGLRMTCAAVLAAEAIGSLTMWSAIPLAWLWIGARVDEATDSVAAAGGVALLGLLGTSVLAMAALTRLDRTWIALRRRAGHRQRQGALTRVVVVSATLGLIAFLLWYYVFSKAYILPFMPSQ